MVCFDDCVMILILLMMVLKEQDEKVQQSIGERFLQFIAFDCGPCTYHTFSLEWNRETDE
jgi:hypothetical protein